MTDLISSDTPPNQREEQFFREEPTGLARELARMLNRASRENASNTPDFILAAYMLDALEAGERLIRRRDRWYSMDPAPGGRR
ncbi:MAG TPA: hypothetical protein VF516_12375 [Kofleriaceae bacterium]